MLPQSLAALAAPRRLLDAPRALWRRLRGAREGVLTRGFVGVRVVDAVCDLGCAYAQDTIFDGCVIILNGGMRINSGCRFRNCEFRGEYGPAFRDFCKRQAATQHLFEDD